VKRSAGTHPRRKRQPDVETVRSAPTSLRNATRLPHLFTALHLRVTIMHWTFPSVVLTISTLLLSAAALPPSNPSPSPEVTQEAPTMTQTNKVTPFLMFNDQLEAAVNFYAATFPDTKIKNIARTGKDGPVTSAEFVIGGQSFMGYNGGSHFSFSEGFSLYVDCKDQAEVDLYWDKLVKAGSKPTMCGWIRDQFGLSWQIVPRRFTELIRDKDPKKVKAVIDAMLKMQKLDVATLERAYAKA
jgi:predicted 3-demethylubiquinone-9 3-methyltransferase (glyoxalase superfamily)